MDFSKNLCWNYNPYTRVEFIWYTVKLFLDKIMFWAPMYPYARYYASHFRNILSYFAYWQRATKIESWKRNELQFYLVSLGYIVAMHENVNIYV